MTNKIRVILTPQDRANLLQLVESESTGIKTRKRAQILLAIDEGPEGDKLTVAEIHDKYNYGHPTVARARKRFVEEGLEVALYGKHKAPKSKRKITPQVEKQVLKLYQSQPPKGHEKWNLRLLAETMCRRRYVKSISYESIRSILNKHYPQLGEIKPVKQNGEEKP